jgi:hypothetical protein
MYDVAYISNKVFSKLQHLASYVSHQYAMAYDTSAFPSGFVVAFAVLALATVPPSLSPPLLLLSLLPSRCILLVASAASASAIAVASASMLSLPSLLPLPLPQPSSLPSPLHPRCLCHLYHRCPCLCLCCCSRCCLDHRSFSAAASAIASSVSSTLHLPLQPLPPLSPSPPPSPTIYCFIGLTLLLLFSLS